MPNWKKLIASGSDASLNSLNVKGTITANAFSGNFQGSIANNLVSANQLNVTGNGTTSQYLRSDGDGSFTWATPPNTTYSVGNGGLTEINFTSTLNTKLAGIAASANNYSLPEATATTRGGIELFSNTDNPTAANAVSSTTGRTYGIQLNSAGQAVVNVPWVDTNTNTTYTAGTGLTLVGTEFRNAAPDQTVSLTGAGATTISGTYPNFTITSTDTNTDTNTVTQIGTADNPTAPGDFTFLGKGATTITQSGGKIYVSSTDTDTNTTYSAGTGLTLSGTTFSLTNTYDNYDGWDLFTDGTSRGRISSGENVNFAGGSNVSLSYSSTNNTITINSTDTNTDTDTITTIAAKGFLPASGDFTFIGNGATTITQEGRYITISSTDTNTDTNTTYTADGNYGLTLSGTTFRLEDDRRRNSTTTDIYSGNTHDYTWYDADVGIRWYTAGAEEMRLQDDGTLHVDGDVVAYSTTVSDERLKDNVTTIQNPLDKIKALRGVEYEWNAGNRKGKRDLGLIAQEVEMVIPEIVHEHELPLIDGESGTIYKTVDYEKMVAVLIEGMKEQQTIINKLEQRIVTLESGSKN